MVKNKKHILAVLSAFVVLIMAFSVLMPLAASANAQDDYNQAQQELEKIEDELNDIQDLKDKQQKEKEQAQNQINLVKTQISSLSSQIEETSAQLAAKQAELDQKKIDIQKTDDLFKSKLKAMYMRRSGNVVATALAVDTFSELLTSVNTLQNISEADTKLLEQLNNEKAEIERVEAEIQNQLTALEESRQLQQQKQDELASLLQKVNDQISETEAQEQAAQVAYENAKAIRDEALKKLEEEFAQDGNVGDYVGGEWRWPVPTNRYVSSYYGYRNIFGYQEFHTGIDIPAGYGTNIIASNSGVVTTATYASTGYGNRVIIDHGGGYKTLYAHCSSLNVSVGQYVNQGDVIAFVGSTGMSTGNHLHFEIRQNNSTVDPYPYVKNN